MPRILIVCTGNICRSPAAELLLKRRLEQEGLTGWIVESAGTWAMEGLPASRHMLQLLSAQGLDGLSHRSREVKRSMMEQADLVLAMTEGHAESLRLEFPDQAHKVYMLSQMVKGQRFNVADPYGGPVEGYQACIEELENLIDAGFERIRALVQGETG